MNNEEDVAITINHNSGQKSTDLAELRYIGKTVMKRKKKKGRKKERNTRFFL